MEKAPSLINNDSKTWQCHCGAYFWTGPRVNVGDRICCRLCSRYYLIDEGDLIQVPYWQYRKVHP